MLPVKTTVLADVSMLFNVPEAVLLTTPEVTCTFRILRCEVYVSRMIVTVLSSVMVAGSIVLPPLSVNAV
ncbi:hypothetical protein D3C71_1338660 [compost metagenome]